jgi:hypothetical protein
MVAAAEPVTETRQCTGPEEYFARLIACEGWNAARAYKVAWKTAASSIDSRQQALRVLHRPHVAAKIAQLRERADAEGIAGLNERRRLLAEKYRVKIDPKKLTHREQIAAIELDSKLNGDLRPDVVNVAVGVSIGEMLGELSKGVGVIPVASATPAATVALAVEAPKAQPAILAQPIVNIAPTAIAAQPEGILPSHAIAVAPEVWEGDE